MPRHPSESVSVCHRKWKQDRCLVSAAKRFILFLSFFLPARRLAPVTDKVGTVGFLFNSHCRASLSPPLPRLSPLPQTKHLTCQTCADSSFLSHRGKTETVIEFLKWKQKGA